MEATQTHEEKPSFETVSADLRQVGIDLQEVRASFQEVRDLHKEAAEWRKETDRLLKETDKIIKENAEQQKETDRIIKATAKQQKETEKQMKETGKQMKETDRRLGLYDNRYGKMLEHMVKPTLVKGFNELGFEVTRAGQNFKIFDAKNNIFTEVDYILEDGDKVIIVEAKSKLTTEDVTDHVERMRKVKAHAESRGDRRIFLGAIAGLIINDNEQNFALKNGFYVIQPSGEAFAITVPEGIYSPKEW